MNVSPRTFQKWLWEMKGELPKAVLSKPKWLKVVLKKYDGRWHDEKGLC